MDRILARGKPDEIEEIRKRFREYEKQNPEWKPYIEDALISQEIPTMPHITEGPRLILRDYTAELQQEFASKIAKTLEKVSTKETTPMADQRPDPRNFALGRDFISVLIKAGLVPAETRAVTIRADKDGLVEVDIEVIGLAQTWNNPILWDATANETT